MTVETKWLPPLTVDLGGGGGPPSQLVKLFKPRVTVQLQGVKLAQVAPAGVPEPNEWPKVKVVVAVVVGLAVFSILRVLR